MKHGDIVGPWLVCLYIGDDILPSYIGTVINHDINGWKITIFSIGNTSSISFIFQPVMLVHQTKKIWIDWNEFDFMFAGILYWFRVVMCHIFVANAILTRSQRY